MKVGEDDRKLAGGEGRWLRLKVQIILCTFCLEDEGMEAFAWLNRGKGGGGLDRKGWCRGQGGG